MRLFSWNQHEGQGVGYMAYLELNDELVEASALITIGTQCVA